MQEYKPEFRQKDFQPARARAIDMHDLPGRWWRQGKVIWWRPPEMTDKNLQDHFKSVTRSDTTFGRFPLTDVELTKSTWNVFDTATSIGRLDQQAALLFSKPKDPYHSQYKLKWPGQTHIPFESRVRDAIPALCAIIMTQKANMPSASLYDAMTLSLRVSRNWIQPGKNAGDVHPNTRRYSEPWHHHFSPREKGKKWSDALQGQYYIGRDCVISDGMGTQICDQFYALQTQEQENKALEQGHQIVQARKLRGRVDDGKYAVISPEELQPFEIGMLSRLSMHRSSDTKLNEPAFRNFARIFALMSSAQYKKYSRENPSEAESIPKTFAEEIFVPSSLQL